jgi:hypothetical protein
MPGVIQCLVNSTLRTFREQPRRGENTTISTVKLLRLGINDSCITFIISFLFILITDLQAAVDQLFLFNFFFFELTKFGQLTTQKLEMK